MPEEITISDYHEIKALAAMNTIQRNDIHRVVNAYKKWIRNRYLCPNCADALWAALQDIKALHKRIEAGWEERISKSNVRDYMGKEQEGKDLSL